VPQARRSGAISQIKRKKCTAGSLPVSSGGTAYGPEAALMCTLGRDLMQHMYVCSAVVF